SSAQPQGKRSGRNSRAREPVPLDELGNPVGVGRLYSDELEHHRVPPDGSTRRRSRDHLHGALQLPVITFSTPQGLEDERTATGVPVAVRLPSVVRSAQASLYCPA